MALVNAQYQSVEIEDGTDPGANKSQHNLATGTKTEDTKVRHWPKYLRCDNDGAVLVPATTGTIDTPFTVTTSSQVAIAAGGAPRGFTLENDSDFKIIYALAAVVTVANGISLYPSERKDFIWPSYETSYQGPVAVIHGDSGTKNLRINRW